MSLTASPAFSVSTTDELVLAVARILTRSLVYNHSPVLPGTTRCGRTMELVVIWVGFGAGVATFVGVFGVALGVVTLR